EADENNMKNLENKLAQQATVIAESKWKIEEDLELFMMSEENRKKAAIELEVLSHQLNEARANVNKFEKSKKKLQSEVDDLNIEIENQRSKVSELEKKQKKFDAMIQEEKELSAKIANERDAAERESREKETRILSLMRELED